jgi:AcrR family transcriptional regulator
MCDDYGKWHASNQNAGSAEVTNSNPKRADAKRNVDLLLQAAKAVFATAGVDAPAKHVALRAGVGVGTLYRHFPLRSDLVVAVLQHELDVCVQKAAALQDAPDARAALHSWIASYAEFVGTKAGLAKALHSDEPAYEGLPQRLLEQLEPALDRLLARAVEKGFVRTDVAAHDILIAIALISQPVPGQSADFVTRMIGVLLDGLGAKQIESARSG